MAFLEVNNLNKYYPITDSERFHALKDVQLSFEKGELVSIIGESGSGKSTLMNLLGGLDSQFDGEILVDGENIGQFKEKEMVAYHKEKIGFIFQSFNLVPHLSILDNVTLAMTLSNVDGKTRKARAKEVLEQLGLYAWNKPVWDVCAGFGGKTVALQERGIAVLTGAAAGKPEDVVREYLAGTLACGANVCDH